MGHAANENGTTWIVQGVRFDDFSGRDIDLSTAKLIDCGSYDSYERAAERAARLASGADDYEGPASNQNYSAAYFYRVKEMHVIKFTDANGDSRDYDAAVNLMDDDLREEVHADLAPCADQRFIEEYAKRHEQRFGEPFAPFAGGEW